MSCCIKIQDRTWEVMGGYRLKITGINAASGINAGRAKLNEVGGVFPFRLTTPLFRETEPNPNS